MLIKVGQIIEGKITAITNFGAFIALPENKSGMIHISEVSDSYVKDINEFLKIGQSVKVRVCSVDENGRISLSIKQAEDNKQKDKVKKTAVRPDLFEAPKIEKTEDFEDMMSKFMKTSNDKLSDLKKAMDSKRSSPGFSRKNAKKY